MSTPTPTREPNRTSRKQVIILLAIAVLLLFVVLASQTAFNNTILQADTNQQAIIFYALSLLISLLFVALTFVLARNLLKLFAEREETGPGGRGEGDQGTAPGEQDHARLRSTSRRT